MVIAHAGGWDEILLFVVPVAVTFVLLRWAEKRARAKKAADETRPEH